MIVGPGHQGLVLFYCQGCISSYCINEFAFQEDCDAFVIISTLICIWGLGQDIHGYVSLPWYVLDFVVILL
jgi:hypothetical protein